MTTPEVEEALKCANGQCSHSEDDDCQHWCGPILAAEVRALRGKIKSDEEFTKSLARTYEKTWLDQVAALREKLGHYEKAIKNHKKNICGQSVEFWKTRSQDNEAKIAELEEGRNKIIDHNARLEDSVYRLEAAIAAKNKVLDHFIFLYAGGYDEGQRQVLKQMALEAYGRSRRKG